MEKRKTKAAIFRSMDEFGRCYFPKSFSEKLLDKPEESNVIGKDIAMQSLKKARRLLTK